jgi:hypothetical protein
MTDYLAEIILNDENDIALVSKAQGATLGDTTLPSGLHISNAPEGYVWIFKGARIVCMVDFREANQ